MSADPSAYFPAPPCPTILREPRDLALLTARSNPGRAEHIDAARGLCILLVVFGHNWILDHDPEGVGPLFSSFRMPLFFFLSGLFLPVRRGLKEMVFGKADSLLKPYFAVSFLVAAVWFLTGDLHPRGFFFGVFYGTLVTIFWCHLWFLPHLFITTMVSWCLARIFDLGGATRLTILTLLSFLLVAGCFSMMAFGDFRLPFLLKGKETIMSGLPWSLDLAFISSFYCLSGFLIRRKVGQLFTARQAWMYILGFLLCYAAFRCSLNMSLRRYDNVVLSTIQAFFGIGAAVSTCSWLCEKTTFGKVLAYIGSASLFVFIWHGPVQSDLFQLYNSIIPEHPNIAAGLAYPPAILIPLLLWELTKRSRILARIFLPMKVVQASS